MTQLTISKTHSDLCKQAAQQIAAQLKEKPDSVIGLATGNTMEPLYRELVRMHEAGEIDFSQAKFVQLDEFCPIAPTSPQSFRYALKTLFLDKIGASEEQCCFIDGKPDFDVQAFEQRIHDIGGIDLQLLGIGRTGHIGFNEGGEKDIARSRTRFVELNQISQEDQASHFGGKAKVIKTAITQGVGTILEAKKILMLVNGAHKAAIAKDMLKQGDVDALPARALQQHANVHMLMDEPATEMLTTKQLETMAEMNAEKAMKHKALFDPIVIELDNGKQLRLPYNADIFLPSVMEVDEVFDRHNPKHLEALKTTLNHITTTYIGAHQDDTELWVPHEVEANENTVKEGKPAQFLSVIATDGAAVTSALKREGEFANMTPEELVATRKREQRCAAKEACFPVIQLQYPTPAVKSQMTPEKSAEIMAMMTSIYDALPKHQTAYTHHPADSHETHQAVAALAVNALRQARIKPTKVIGTPGWGQTGINDVKFPVKDPEIVNRLLKHYESQLEMQSRNYDIAGTAILLANSAFLSDPHAEAEREGMVIGLDITKAVTQRKPLGEIVKEAYDKKAAQSIAQLNKVGPVGTPENAPQGFVANIKRPQSHIRS